MKRSIIRLTIILGVIAITGIIAVQVYLIRTSHRLEEKQLNQSIKLALRNVAEIISSYQESTLPYEDVVYQYSSNYFIVNVNTTIDATLLEHYLIKEFESRNIHISFEYAIYDCSTDEMVYGNFICTDNCEEHKLSTELPKYNEYMYYFGVSFPSREKYVLNNMKIWYFFSGVLFLVILFFGYTQFIILKQKKLSEFQKDFIDNITHEFKTPISSIFLSADVLLENEITHEPERLRKYATIIKNQIQFLQQQVERVLHLSGKNVTSNNLKIEKFLLNDVLKNCIENLEPEAKNLNGKIEYQSNCKKGMVLADKLHFISTINNLVENALKYNDKQPQINLVLDCSPKKATISIKDNGPGIPLRQKNKVFNKFYRVPTGNIHNTKGFGLGLSYVKKVAKMHGWKIKMNSIVDEGTTFEIIIPLLKEKK